MNNIMILIALVVGTMMTRFIPFVLFPEGKGIPKFIEYLGKHLPYASMGLLVVYCLKGINVMTGSHGLPELMAVSFTAMLYAWKKNVLVSIFLGTVTYMFLVQVIF